LEVVVLDIYSGNIDSVATDVEPGFTAVPADPETSRMVIEWNSQLCASIRVIESGRVVSGAYSAQIGGAHIPLESVPIDPTACDSAVRIGRPDLRRGDQAVAAFVSEPSGGDMSALASEGWSLELLVPDVAASTLKNGVSGPGPARFGPDGDEIAFTGTIDGSQAAWVMTSEGEDLHPAAEGAVAVEWSPDGDRLMVAQLVGGESGGFEVAIVDE
jgi:hypothetical protein